jgi:ABC-type branched-subunit amino acid transport system substrate-binding protein
MAGARLNPALFGTHTLGGKDPIAAIQQQTGGAFFAANYVDEAFHKQYLEQYGGDIQVTWAANAYDFAMLTAELFGKRGEKLTGEQIIAEYKKVKDKTGVTGKFSYVENDNYGAGFVFPVVMKTISKSGVTAAPLN